MAIKKTGLHLLLSVAAVLGCSISVLSATGPAIQYSDAAVTTQARV